MNERIKAYLSNHFGPNWEEKFNSQEREFMIEVLYVNRILSLKEVFDLGWILGYSKAEKNRKEEVLPPGNIKFHGNTANGHTTN